jgi:hypothetical protein
MDTDKNGFKCINGLIRALLRFPVVGIQPVLTAATSAFNEALAPPKSIRVLSL